MVRIAQLEPSGRTVLGCQGCGERLVLVGLEEDWRSEGRTTFACGEEVTLDDDRLADEGPTTTREYGGP
ncbi:MAG: hypothetical protein M3R38_21690 [Actinomycetota bacterium]|nr:hypothetical protein [Actinomycetota bacterium]